jgi:hypothetical protein
LPLDFSFPFRKGDVGGERGFDAALAFRAVEGPASALDGESMKTNINTHNTTPTMIVSGLVRRNDRTGPMAPLCCCVSSIDEKFRGIRIACVQSPRSAIRVVRLFTGEDGRPSSLSQVLGPLTDCTFGWDCWGW